MMAGLKISVLVMIILTSENGNNWINKAIFVKTQKISEKQLQIDPINNNVSETNMCNCRTQELFMPVRGSTHFQTEYISVSEYISKALKVKSDRF